MKKNKLLLICLLLIFVAFSMHSCKDDEQAEPEWDPSGLYNVKIQVDKRPPAIEEPNHEDIDYDHVILYDQVFDTTQSKPCYYGPRRYPYPVSYEIANFRIYKNGTKYYIFNNMDTFNPQGSTYSIPLIKQGNSFRTNILELEGKNFFVVGPSMVSSRIDWPGWFYLLNFEMKRNEDLTIIGKWRFLDKTDVCSIQVSSGAYKNYFNSEFADLTFERIGD